MVGIDTAILAILIFGILKLCGVQILNRTIPIINVSLSRYWDILFGSAGIVLIYACFLDLPDFLKRTFGIDRDNDGKISVLDLAVFVSLFVIVVVGLAIGLDMALSSGLGSGLSSVLGFAEGLLVGCFVAFGVGLGASLGAGLTSLIINLHKKIRGLNN